MITLLGVIGTNEVIFLLIFILLPILFYWLGWRSGFRKGQLDLYKEMDKKNNKSIN